MARGLNVVYVPIIPATARGFGFARRGFRRWRFRNRRWRRFRRGRRNGFDGFGYWRWFGRGRRFRISPEQLRVCLDVFLKRRPG